MNILQPMRKLYSHAHNVPFVSISPDNEYIASVSIDKTMKVCNFEGDELGKFKIIEWFFFL